MRDVRASLIARVYTIPLKNGFEKTVSRYSGAFSIKAKMYAGIPHEYIHKRARGAVAPPLGPRTMTFQGTDLVCSTVFQAQNR